MRSLGGYAASAASFGCALGLAACAGLTQTPPASSVVFAAALPSFEAAGRLSVRHGIDALTANFRWQRDGNHDEVDLASPLGQTIARLTGDGDGVALRTADGRVATGSDWAALTAQSLGWPLPVDGLAFWIQGAPRTGASYTTEPGDDGRPRLLRQDGWTIVTSRSLRARTTPAALHA
jgi:outer membrane lipoprotein LolB